MEEKINIVKNRSLETERGSKEEYWHHILRCEGTKIRRYQILDKRNRHYEDCRMQG
jgi:hypothetical protein